MLESTSARIPLIKPSHKWTRMLFIISNSKLGIWLCSQPRIDLKLQYNFYDILTRPYKYLSNTISTLSIKQHALKTIYMLVSPHCAPAARRVHAIMGGGSLPPPFAAARVKRA